MKRKATDIDLPQTVARLARTPVRIMTFSKKQSPTERSQSIRDIPKEAGQEVRRIILRMVKVQNWERPANTSLEFLMGLDKERQKTGLQLFNDNWCLRMYTNSEGSMYDFNGWFFMGDQQMGACVFRSPTGERYEVFDNWLSERGLTESTFLLHNWLREYENTRFVDDCDSDDDDDDDDDEDDDDDAATQGG